jgi:hypothetical protein
MPIKISKEKAENKVILELAEHVDVSSTLPGIGPSILLHGHFGSTKTNDFLHIVLHSSLPLPYT